MILSNPYLPFLAKHCIVVQNKLLHIKFESVALRLVRFAFVSHDLMSPIQVLVVSRGHKDHWSVGNTHFVASTFDVDVDSPLPFRGCSFRMAI